MARIVDWDRHIGGRLRLRNLHVFFVVVQMGSLAKAAAHFGVSQPAVSQLIGDLEHALGVKLFDRSPRGVEPTVYGRALLARGRAAFDELKQGIRDIEFLSEAATGEVKIGCPEAIALLLPPVVAAFTRKYPGVVIDVQDEEFDRSATKLRERNLDFIVQRLRGRPRADDPFFDDFDVDVILDDEIVIVAGAQTALARRRKVELSDLQRETWILAVPESWNHRVISEAFQKDGLEMPKVSLRTFSTHLRVSMVSSGEFIATFPRSVAEHYAERFGLKVLPVDLPRHPWPVAILALKHRTLSPVAHLLMEHIRTALAPEIRRTRAIKNQSPSPDTGEGD